MIACSVIAAEVAGGAELGVSVWASSCAGRGMLRMKSNPGRPTVYIKAIPAKILVDF